MHTVPLAVFCFARWGREALVAIQRAIAAGGDTDKTAAIVCAWGGALGGAGSLPGALIARINDGPFGPSHLRALGRAIALGGPAPRYSEACAFARNLALHPVVLAHGLGRLVPW